MTVLQDRIDRLERIIAAGKGQPGRYRTMLRLQEAIQSDGAFWEVIIVGPDTPESVISDGDITLIRDKNDRLLPVGMLKRAVPMFEGVAVFDNHLTRAEVVHREGKRSVKNELVGVISKVRWRQNRLSIVGVLSVICPKMKSKLVLAAKAGILNKIGLSMDTYAVGHPFSVGDFNGTLVTKITRVVSVDIVANPAAGGRFEKICNDVQCGRR